ncbi:MAG: F0F1 ATP synthase subunit B' [Campylobacterales bacterium]|nr:F0F1 ATP synthase subunit B' [Campylobacterales bacterium]
MLDISPILLGSTIVVFLALIALLNSWLYNPLFSYMEKRDADIARDLSEVGNNDAEIAALEAKAQKIVNDAKLEAAALREKVIADAKELAEGKVEAKRAELAKAYDEFEASLGLQREQLRNALLSQLPLFKEAVKAKFAQI